MHAFDRQTDGQTDGILIARPRLHSMQRGKNVAEFTKNTGQHDVGGWELWICVETTAKKVITS